jgi:hypothetical protein
MASADPLTHSPKGNDFGRQMIRFVRRMLPVPRALVPKQVAN